MWVLICFLVFSFSRLTPPPPIDGAELPINFVHGAQCLFGHQTFSAYEPDTCTGAWLGVHTRIQRWWWWWRVVLSSVDDLITPC